MTATMLGRLVRVLTLPTFTDQRGDLIPITFTDWEFEAFRSFVVTAPAGSVRGGHAHRTCRQVLMRVSGIVDVHVRAGDAEDTLRLDASTPAVLIEPGIWAQQTYVTDNSALVVFADAPYDPEDYMDTDPATGALAAAPPADGDPTA